MRPFFWQITTEVLYLTTLSFCTSDVAAKKESLSFPISVRHFASSNARSRESSPDQGIPQKEVAMAMLQKGFSKQKQAVGSNKSADGDVFRWGISPESEHPPSIGKWHPHQKIQDYEATLPKFNGMVLNIFGKASNGNGGLMLALEVPSPCNAQEWVQVDRARCSSIYPCALRLPASAVTGGEAVPTRFRTVVVLEDEDYATDFLEYNRVTLDHEVEVTVGQENFGDERAEPWQTKAVKLHINSVLASGPLTVSPVIKDASPDSVVAMRVRQPEPVYLVQSGTDLEKSLVSYRKSWAGEWRDAAKPISGCGHSQFEVVADQLYPGEVEVEVFLTTGSAVISDVVVTARMSWAEAEVALLDATLKDHFNYFNDPDTIVHGIPVGAVKKGDNSFVSYSNPTEWGYAMQSWAVMAETGVLQPEEVVGKLRETFQTLETLQNDPNQFAHGMFYPYYKLKEAGSGEKVFPTRTDYDELPCGDDALVYASLMMIQGWLRDKGFHTDADTCGRITGRMDFSKCVRYSGCDGSVDGEQFWQVPLTVNANTLQTNSYNWNVWADEGGLVAMIVALTGGIDDVQYESIVRQQQRYSPCSHWEGVTVDHAAFFNSVFTLPTRSMLGFGTLFSSPYYHEFAVRSVLPTFRAHQKLKKVLSVDYIGPSDAMTMQPRGHSDKIFGSYAYWPPNNMYDCKQGRVLFENQCTWCKGIQYEGLDDGFDTVVPHGNMASFLVSASMEKSQFTDWLEDVKKLMTDLSSVYKPGYGFEVMAPARRTPPGGGFEGAQAGRGIWESLSNGYTILSMYEGLATISRRYAMAKQAGLEVRGYYEPPSYRPLSDFVDVLPDVRTKINSLLMMAKSQESTEKQCPPSAYGPV